jgi:flagellar motor protein MotB
MAHFSPAAAAAGTPKKHEQKQPQQPHPDEPTAAEEPAAAAEAVPASIDEPVQEQEVQQQAEQQQQPKKKKKKQNKLLSEEKLRRLKEQHDRCVGMARCLCRYCKRHAAVCALQVYVACTWSVASNPSMQLSLTDTTAAAVAAVLSRCSSTLPAVRVWVLEQLHCQ